MKNPKEDAIALVIAQLKKIKRSNGYGPMDPRVASAAALLVLLPYLAVLALFVAGVVAVPWDRARLLLLGFLLYYTAIHIATHGYARYRLPAMPVLFLLAAWAITEWRAGAYPRLSGVRCALAAAIALALGLSLVPSLRINLADPAFGLVHGPASTPAPGPEP